MKYLFALSFLLVMSTRFCQANVVWDKEISEFRTSVALEHNDNLFNSTTDSLHERFVRVLGDIRWLALYDGFGVYFPTTIKYRAADINAEFDASEVFLRPEVHFFVQDQVELNAAFSYERSNKLGGDSGAEFLQNQSIEQLSKSVELALLLGRAPELQYLHFNLNLAAKEQRLKNQSLNQIDTLQLDALYGHRFTEDSYWLSHLNLQSEQSGRQQSELIEFGLGFKTQFASEHQLSVITGIFERSGDSKRRGQYWQVSDSWQINADHQLRLLTSQRSEVSTTLNALTQLRTQAAVLYQITMSADHQLSFSLEYNSLALDELNRTHDSWAGFLLWRWSVIDRLTTAFSFGHTTAKDTLIEDESAQNLINMAVEYLW